MNNTYIYKNLNYHRTLSLNTHTKDTGRLDVSTDLQFSIVSANPAMSVYVFVSMNHVMLCDFAFVSISRYPNQTSQSE